MNDDSKIDLEAGQPVAAPTWRPIRMLRLLRGVERPAGQVAPKQPKLKACRAEALKKGLAGDAAGFFSRVVWADRTGCFPG